ncbi:hypothetical protein QZH41_005896, partial [Actinostola sp. cb2023]
DGIRLSIVDVGQKENEVKEEKEEDNAFGEDEFSLDNDLQEKKLGEVTAVLDMDGLWGKFGQNPHLPVTEYVDDPKRFAELMFGPKTEVRHLLLINENWPQLQYDKVDDFTRESGFASVVHAAFVTSFARLKLYRYLEELQERVLYFDTDSIFYVTHPGQALLPLGDYLGDLTSELKRPGDFIREFVSTGPKSYAYVTDQGMEEKYVVTEPHRIQRDAKRRQLKTVEMSKDFRVVYDKRVRRRVDTVPYGYLDERENER